MVAYSFKARFEAPILAGTKVGTIRAVGLRRHANPGDALQLYVAMRTKQCRKIMDTTCTGQNGVRFNLTSERRPLLYRNFAPIRGDERDEFAIADGFEDFGDMVAFWLDTHGPVDFRGVHVVWAALPSPVRG